MLRFPPLFKNKILGMIYAVYHLLHGRSEKSDFFGSIFNS